MSHCRKNLVNIVTFFRKENPPKYYIVIVIPSRNLVVNFCISILSICVKRLLTNSFFYCSCRGTLEFMTTEKKISSVNVEQRNYSSGALCVGLESMLFFVDDSALPLKIIHLDCSKVSDTRWDGFTQTEEHQIYDICFVRQPVNTKLLITANGESGISAYTMSTGSLEWKIEGVIPRTKKRMNARAVAADSHGRVFVCDSANKCIQLFSIDGAYYRPQT